MKPISATEAVAARLGSVPLIAHVSAPTRLNFACNLRLPISIGHATATVRPVVAELTSSVTVTDTAYAPQLVNTCDGAQSALLSPSAKSHRQLSRFPFVLEAPTENPIVSPGLTTAMPPSVPSVFVATGGDVICTSLPNEKLRTLLIHERCAETRLA